MRLLVVPGPGYLAFIFPYISSASALHSFLQQRNLSPVLDKYSTVATLLPFSLINEYAVLYAG